MTKKQKQAMRSLFPATAAMLSTLALLCSTPGARAAGAEPQLPAQLHDLPLPIDCKLGEDCFFQNLPDMDPGPGVKDPFCHSASYNGHKGTDIRIRSLGDMVKGYNVLAIMDGVVERSRDEMPDRLVRTGADRKRVKGRECGNGMLIDHGNGLKTQYCHMMKESLQVRPGHKVKAGTVLGQVGVSGSTQFPHVHISFTLNGRELDPNTGRFLDEGGCTDIKEARSVWNAEIVDNLAAGQTQLLQSGVSGIPAIHNKLVVVGGPPKARVGEPFTIGWAWFINLQAGDTITMALYKNGKRLTEKTAKPVERAKASYSQYIGKRTPFQPGNYRLDVRLNRQGKDVLTDSREVTVY